MGTEGSAAKAADRTQVGLPDSTDDLLKELRSNTRWFRDEVDVYRVAVTVALARGLRPREDEVDSGYTTKFSVQTLDPDGDLKLLIMSLVPAYGDSPYRWAQSLANKGVHYLHNEIVRNGRSIAEVLGAADR
ncbi:MAG: hypothetical protein KKA32_04185 [Actinobacteria bacterium]|nr:hypothetical protein [Actinomycetota bacterium]